jgi:hypothetical protein
MSWTRKLFAQGGQNTNTVTSFLTNTTTVWNTNTFRNTNVITDRPTTTSWTLPGNTTTVWSTNWNTDGTASRNTDRVTTTSWSTTTSWDIYEPIYQNTCRDTSVSYSTCWSTFDYSYVSSYACNTTECYNTYLGQSCYNDTYVGTTCWSLYQNTCDPVVTSYSTQNESGCIYYDQYGNVTSQDSASCPPQSCSQSGSTTATGTYSTSFTTTECYQYEMGCLTGAGCLDAGAYGEYCSDPTQTDPSCSYCSSCTAYCMFTTTYTVNSTYQASYTDSVCFDCVTVCTSESQNCYNTVVGQDCRNTTYPTSICADLYRNTCTTFGTTCQDTVNVYRNTCQTTTSTGSTCWNTLVGYNQVGSDSRNTTESRNTTTSWTTTWGGIFNTSQDTSQLTSTINTYNSNTTTQWSTVATTTWATEYSQNTNTTTSRTTTWVTG